MRKRKPGRECTDAELAAWTKTLPDERQAAYSRYVQALSLKPRITAKEFFEIYDAVKPAPWPGETHTVEDINVTHRDTLLDCPVQITHRADGYELTWPHGVIGYEPGDLNSMWTYDRYKPLDG